MPVESFPQLEDWNDPDTTSKWLGVPTATLAQWRHRRVGPEFAKFGRHVRYHRDALRDWTSAQTVR